MRLSILWLLTLSFGAAQIRVPLEQANSRAGTDFGPAMEGQQVAIQGQISAAPIWIMDAYYLPIQDAEGYGMLLSGTMQAIRSFSPGDWIEASGTIYKRGGSPILHPDEIRKIGSGPAPQPKVVSVGDLASYRYFGVLITVESKIAEVGQDAGGDMFDLEERGRTVSVFMPKARREDGPGLGKFGAGDTVRVTGIGNQYCTLPPYEGSYQVLIPNAEAVSLVRKGWLIPPRRLVMSLMVLILVTGVWWVRDRRLRDQHRRMRLLNTLGEEVIASNSPAEILRKLNLTLPKLLPQTSINIYLFNRRAHALESVQEPTGEGPGLVDVDAPSGPAASNLALCFRNRTLMAIPDSRRNPFGRGALAGTARGMLLVPMLAQNEPLGILEIVDPEHSHAFTSEEQSAMQHLANQVATALKLQEQHSIREQLFRSEKLAATGQLISGVANELQAPLGIIGALTSHLLSEAVPGLEPELRTISKEAHRASEIVARLVSFAHIEKAEAQPVDMGQVLASMLEFRARELEQKGIEVHLQVAARSPLMVLGSQGQLEQVLLNLLVEAEHAAVEAREKVISITSGQLARRILIEIVYNTRANEPLMTEPGDDLSNPVALGLAVCRGIVQSHGGDFRASRGAQGKARFELELPALDVLAKENRGGQPGAPRQLTVLLVEPDNRSQRQIVQLLSARGDRVIPLSNGEEGVDLTQRMRFDLAICSVRLPGWSWVQFYERVRGNVNGVVLLTDGYDADLARSFQNSEGFVLSKPVDEASLHRICQLMEERATVRT
ncbi:MAG TPA: GAF domain-containing protein [Bryobacteraceae bacterium]|nr:GAF domain-containing protein [Bryobacteraceae bacterium]